MSRILFVSLVILLAACSLAAPTTPTIEPSQPTAAEVIVSPIATSIPPTPIPVQPTALPPTTAPTAYSVPAWASLSLTNSRTGETFALADFAGKTLYVETMATWCPPCRTQLSSVNQVMTRVSQEEYMFVALSVGENISDDDLARYANDNGFNMSFALATPELHQALVDHFGFSVSSPPSTPHFTISPGGAVSSLHTGLSGADALVAELSEASASLTGL